MSEVRIFTVNTAALEEASCFARAEALCTDKRRERTARYRREADKRLSVAAELLLRYALSELSAEADLSRLEYGPHGKPYLPDCPFFFNLSHSGSFAVCAVGSVELGIDLEKKRDRGKDFSRIASHFFSSEEEQVLADIADEAERMDCFYRLWTLKESYLKALGTGISQPLSELKLSLEPLRVEQSPDEHLFSLYEPDAPEGYAMALACAGDSLVLPPEELTVAALIRRAEDLRAEASLSFRPLLESDFDTLYAWMQDERVLGFYEGRDSAFTPDSLHKCFFEKPGFIRQLVIEVDGQPIGYGQYYPLSGDMFADYGLEDRGELVFGADQFIGIPELWGKGYGRCYMKKLARYLFEELGADRLVVDPQLRNPRAIACYQRAGFCIEKRLEAHELFEGKAEDCVLMQYA